MPVEAMKITDVKTFVVGNPWKNWIFVKVYTDEGVTGLGEATGGLTTKPHLGDVEESYLHNQGFDEALFTPMNQITSLYNPQGNAVNAVLGLHLRSIPRTPTSWIVRA